MTTILGIAGSLRRHSYNRGLLHAAAELMPDGATLEIAELAGIPLYDGDLEEAEGMPAAAAALKERIAAADGLVLASPEYNGSVPGVLKNAIDWVSRPQSDQKRVFHGKPALVIGATPGPSGTAGGQTAWLPVLHVLGLDHWGAGRLAVPSAHTVFDDEGRLTDEALRERLRKLLAGFVAHARRR
ncbi:MAG: NADPH-dependent FMN reductase [Sphingomonas sp.]